MSQNRPDRHVPPTSANAKSHQPAREPQPGECRPFSASIEENADRLMDQVFGDVEQLLERGAQLQLDVNEASAPPPQPSNVLEFPGAAAITPQNVAVPSSVSSSLALLPKLSPRQLTREEEIPDNSLDNINADSELFSALAQEEKPQPAASGSSGNWLMAIAFISLLMSSALWVFVRYYLPKTTATANVPAAEILQAKQDAEFLTYVQRSMERIDRASKQAETTAQIESGGSPSALPPLYVPLPPPPNAIAISPASVPSPTTRISVAPLPPVSAIPTTPTTVPAPPTSIPSAPAVAPTAVIPNIIPSPTHALIGLLELGDRSAALFEINGAPQRIQVGEAIGSSGWALVSVSGEEAIVRRNGEVRSVFIGQTF